MPNPFEDRLDRLARASLPERKSDVLRQIGKIKAEHSARGVLHSSMTVQRIDEILARELEARSILIWQAIVRVHKIVGVDSADDLATYFKSLFNKYLNESLAELAPIFEEETRKNPLPIPSKLKIVSALSTNKHDIEIDLYVDSFPEAQVHLKRLGGHHCA